jgi:hypothetical protein
MRCLEDGRVSGLCLLSPHLTEDNAEKLLGEARGKTKRETEALVARHAPRPDVPTSIRKVLAPRAKQAGAPKLAPGQVSLCKPLESVRPAPQAKATVEPLSAHRYHIRFTASATLKKKLDQAMELAPMGTDVETIIERAVAAYVDTLVKKRFGVSSSMPKFALDNRRPTTDNR